MNEDLIQKIIEGRKGEKWWIESERKVVAKYGKLFSRQNLDYLSREDFKSFLLIKNNLHWDGIHRQGNLITSDMAALRKCLRNLLDENVPIKERLNQIFNVKGKGEYVIRGLGKAVITPILMVVYPDNYGVWNSRSEDALKKLGLFPTFLKKDGFADKYIKVNEVLKELANKYNISLWGLDGVLGEISGLGPFEAKTSEDEVIEEAVEHGITDLTNFGMESHLEDFLVTNWDKTIFGKDYDLIYEEGDLKSQQYPTDVGQIDILAISKDKKEYLVIELKKGRSSDAVVGQILRYISWVEENLSEHKKVVSGAIVLLDSDEKLKYSLKKLDFIALYTYKVDFQLIKKEV